MSSVKSTSNPHPDLLRTPPGSFSKQDIPVLSLNKSPVKSERRQEPPSSTKVPIQPFTDVPPRAQSRAANFITLGRFHIDSTITRLRICRWVLLLTIKMLSILTATVFWLATPIFLKNLLNWQAPGKIIYELTLRYLSNMPPTTPIWKNIFPGTDYSNSPHLRLTVHASSYQHSPIIYTTSIPLILDNPMIWLVLLVSMFIGHHLLCFTHDCLSKVSPTIRAANA